MTGQDERRRHGGIKGRRRGWRVDRKRGREAEEERRGEVRRWKGRGRSRRRNEAMKGAHQMKRCKAETDRGRNDIWQFLPLLPSPLSLVHPLVLPSPLSPLSQDELNVTDVREKHAFCRSLQPCTGKEHLQPWTSLSLGEKEGEAAVRLFCAQTLWSRSLSLPECTEKAPLWFLINTTVTVGPDREHSS